MKLLNPAIASSIALALAATATPTSAQAPAAAAPAQRQLKLSTAASKSIMELQTAVKAKSSATIPGLIATAQAAAKNDDDRAAIASLQLQAAIDSNDPAALVAAADASRATGSNSSLMPRVYLQAARSYGAANQYAQANVVLDKALALDPNDVDSLLFKSDIAMKLQQPAASVAAINQAIARQKALGKVVPEAWYGAAVGRAYDAKLPAAFEASRQWVAAYPTQAHWHDVIGIYRNLSGADRAALIDMFRLARVTKTLSGEADYLGASQTFSARGYPGEALAILDEGVAAKAISLSSVTLARPYALAKGKSLGDRAVALAGAKTGLTAPTAAVTLAAADRLLGYGEFAQAATLYRAALGKPGADVNVINLRLGEALGQSGDKAGATAALQLAGGPQSEIAKYWLAWVSTR